MKNVSARRSPVPVAILVMLFAFGARARAQDGSGFAVSASPAFLLPLPGTPSAERFSYGGGVSVLATWVPPGLGLLSLGASLDYCLEPHSSGQNLQVVGASARAGLRLSPWTGFEAALWGGGGLGFGMLGSAGALVPTLSGGLDLGLYLSPSFRLALGAAYAHWFAGSGPLYQGLSASLSVGYNFSQANRRSRVELRDIIVYPVFPVFYKYYDDHALGSLLLRNGEDGPIEDIRVSFFVKQYMEAPTECVSIPAMKRGESSRVELHALFSRSILSVLEATKAQAEIVVTYRYAGRQTEARTSVAAIVNHRNGMTWDDDRKAASFVTTNDPAVLRLSKLAASLSRSGDYQSFDLAFREALGIFEAMRLYGLRYVVDPNTPHAKYESDEASVDYLQFPGQTLEFRSGDCDDLSILTTALLEAAGIETAFITVPGHIYVAAALSSPPDQLSSLLARPEDIIVEGGKAWLPIEVTAVQEGFLRAWQLGAREWREAKAAGNAGFFPLHEAWGTYAAVAMPDEVKIDLPKGDDILARYDSTMGKFVDNETAQRAEALRSAAAAAAARKDPRPYVRLGILYARYGLLAKAEAAFRDSIKVQDNASAWCNIGNVLYLKGDYAGSLTAYKSAQRLALNDPKILAGLARAAYELDDRAGASRYLAALAAVDPAAAARLAYIGGGAGASGTVRAGATDAAGTIEWRD
jgi:tetratricopeptide (TPR) repeat protein